MKRRIAVMIVVLVSAFMLMGCLTDPVEMPGASNQGTTEPETPPAPAPEEDEPVQPEDQRIPVADILDNPIDFPDWFVGQEMLVVEASEGYEEIVGKTTTFQLSINDIYVEPDVRGTVETTDDSYVLEYHIEAEEETAYIKYSVTRNSDDTFTFSVEASEGGNSTCMTLHTRYKK